MKQLMTDVLVTKFTWPGSATSEKFGDTKVSNLLFGKRCLIATISILFLDIQN